MLVEAALSAPASLLLAFGPLVFLLLSEQELAPLIIAQSPVQRHLLSQPA